MKAHILEHLDAYQSWEGSMAASQAQVVKSGLHAPFDAAAAKEATGSKRKGFSRLEPFEAF